MWHEMVKNLAKFQSAVLTGTDAEGYPFSIRCTPQIDPSEKVLRLENMEDLPIQTGPAGLMCHSHNVWMWDLKTFMVRGNLRQDERGWVFQPAQYIPRGGSGGPLDQLKALRKMRKTSIRYLEKRGLSRPKIQWRGIKKLWEEIKKGK